MFDMLLKLIGSKEKIWHTAYVHQEKGLSRCEKNQAGLSQKESNDFLLINDKKSFVFSKFIFLKFCSID